MRAFVRAVRVCCPNNPEVKGVILTAIALMVESAVLASSEGNLNAMYDYIGRYPYFGSCGEYLPHKQLETYLMVFYQDLVSYCVHSIKTAHRIEKCKLKTPPFNEIYCIILI